VITIEFEDRDPERARQVAQAYIDELFNLSETVNISEAGQRRAFFEKQLLSAKDQLANAEIELKKVQQATGLIVPSEQARASIEGVARIRAMISAKEVQIAAMQHFATSTNPELQQAQQELAALRSQLPKLERGQPGTDSDTSSIVAPGRVPESAMEFIRKFRDFKYHETIYELLTKQLELARLEEAKDYAALQVLDLPVRPDQRSKPYRSLIMALGALAGLIGSAVYWVYKEKAADPDRSSAWQRWEVVKSYWQRGGAR
jgi:capsule polysaccharide export protein KpsE/RkpR